MPEDPDAIVLGEGDTSRPITRAGFHVVPLFDHHNRFGTA